MAGPLALLDANVLYPIGLVDLLLRLADRKLFRPRWSATIHDEWTRNVIKNHLDLTPHQVYYRRDCMDRAFPEASVTGYEVSVGDLVLPDPDDRHVLAAAVRGAVEFLVTFNLNHFPAERLRTFDIIPIHPDPFTAGLLTAPENRPPAREVIRALFGDPSDPGGETVRRIDRLKRLMMPMTADAVLLLLGVT